MVTLLVLCGNFCAHESGMAQGVNAADNITKIDLIYSNDAFLGGVRNQAMVFKYDRALATKWGVVLEVPLLYFSSPGFNQSGLGDTFSVVLRPAMARKSLGPNWAAAAHKTGTRRHNFQCAVSVRRAGWSYRST